MTLIEAETQAAPPAAMAAFLRGLERRAAVFAELQAGDAAVGDFAVATTMLQWHAHARALAMGDWPVAFWSALLAQPPLRTRTPVALCLQASDRLGELDFGPRAALLLRLAAGLEEREAAAALGMSEADYVLALRQAVPREADGSHDLEAWHRLRDEVHRRTRTLPPSRLLRLSSAREAALQATPAASISAGSRDGGSRRMSPVLVVLWALLAGCALALLATFLPSAGDWLDRRSGAMPARGHLPDVPAASYYTPAAGLVAHPDFALLAAPEAEGAADLAFNSWLVAQEAEFAGGADPLISTSAPAAPDETPDPDAGESDDAQI